MKLSPDLQNTSKVVMYATSKCSRVQLQMLCHKHLAKEEKKLHRNKQIVIFAEGNKHTACFLETIF